MICPYKVKHANPKHQHFTCQFCSHIFCYPLALAQHAIKKHDGKIKLPAV